MANDEFPAKLTDHEVREAFNSQLERWAITDPNPYNKMAAADELERRKQAGRDERAMKVGVADTTESKGQDRAALPFDPRIEISADAKHIASRIVTHMWILFVLLPVCTFILLGITGVIK